MFSGRNEYANNVTDFSVVKVYLTIQLFEVGIAWERNFYGKILEALGKIFVGH